MRGITTVIGSLAYCFCGLVGAQVDDFSDGDDAQWLRFDPVGQALGGNFAQFIEADGRYRLVSGASPMPGAVGPARAASFRPDLYADFCVSVDVPMHDLQEEQAFGILARVQPNPGLGAVFGYAMTFHPVDNDIQITRVENEQPIEISQFIHLSSQPASGVLRLVFFGIGDLLVGRVYDAGNPLVPLAETSTVDAAYGSGMCGVVISNNTETGTGAADATFDNYFAIEKLPEQMEVTINAQGTFQLEWKFPFLAHAVEMSGNLVDWGEPDDDDGLLQYEDGRFRFETGITAKQAYFRIRPLDYFSN